MSTNSFIGIRHLDGSISGIYCHWDGYPQGVGRTLYAYYGNLRKIIQLINLGDISSLRRHVKSQSFVDDAATVAYARDRGEGWGYVAPKHFSDIDTAIRRSSYEFVYIWEQRLNCWWFGETKFEENEEGVFETTLMYYRELTDVDVGYHT